MKWIIIANGAMSDYVRFRQFIPDYRMICADGGANHAYQLGIRPELVIGDMDSLAPPVRLWLTESGVPFVHAACEKDDTDTGLAIDWIINHNSRPEEIVLLGCLGGRLDHTMVNIQLLMAGYRDGVRIRLIDENQQVFLITPQWPGEFTGKGTCISLLAYTPQVIGVTTHNLKYSLQDAVLTHDRPIGVSNILTSAKATVTVQDGVLLAFVNTEN